MKSLVLMRPFKAFTASMTSGATTEGSATVSRLLTPNPKEAFYTPTAGTFVVTIDLGSLQRVDGLFLGYNWNGLATDTASASFRSGSTTVVGTIPSQVFAPPTDALDYNGWFGRLANVVSARYVDITITTTTATTLGLAAIGRCFSATWGTEWGAGRSIGDTGSVERLFGGGLAIDEGTTFAGYKWTFGDLTATEVEDLYALVKRLGTSRSLFVSENPDVEAGLNNRQHWGVFTKLDQFDRLDPVNTKWSLEIMDWS